MYCVADNGRNSGSAGAQTEDSRLRFGGLVVLVSCELCVAGVPPSAVQRLRFRFLHVRCGEFPRGAGHSQILYTRSGKYFGTPDRGSLVPDRSGLSYCSP